VARLRLPLEQPITGLRFSSDGRTLGIMTLTAFPDGAAAFTRFDARTGRRIAGPVRVNRAGYSPLLMTGDGRRMVVTGDDGVTVRDAATLAVLERFRQVPLGALVPSSLSFQTVSAPYALSGDDRTMAIGGTDGSLRLLDLETGDLRKASGRHAAAVSDARFTPDGRSVVTTGDDGDVIVWDARRATATETLSGHAGFVFSPMISRDGTTLYTASLDGTVFIWDLAGRERLGRPLRVGAEGTGSAGMALSSDGRVVAFARRGGAVAVVDARSLTERRTIRVLAVGSITRLVFAPGGHLLVVGGDTGALALVDTDSGRVTRMRGHRGYIITPGVSADGRRLVTASVDGTVRLWSLPPGARCAPRCASPTASTTPSSVPMGAEWRWCSLPTTGCPTGCRSGTSAAAASRSTCAPAPIPTPYGSAPTAEPSPWPTTAAEPRSGRPRPGSRSRARSPGTPGW
jgi:WD40 repeat protein